MRKKLGWLGAAVAVALVATGAAVATSGGAKSVASVGATFTATQVTKARTSTCTNADGTWQRVDATYTGPATGDTAFAGNVQLDVHSVVNTTKNLGVVSGTLRVANTKAGFTAVYANGALTGLADGRIRGTGARVLANLSASFSPTGGFTNGKLGGSDGGAAIAIASGACKPQPKQRAKLDVRGTVVSTSNGSLVLKSGDDQITCTIGSSLATKIAKLTVGANVRATCLLSGGSYQLTSVSSGKH